MTPAEQLIAWREEIGADLERLVAERTPLQAEIETVKREIERRMFEHNERVSAYTAGVGRFSDGLARCIWSRIEDERCELMRDITRMRGNRPGRIKALDEQIADRRLALTQISRALEPPSRSRDRVRPRQPINLGLASDYQVTEVAH